MKTSRKALFVLYILLCCCITVNAGAQTTNDAEEDNSYYDEGSLLVDDQTYTFVHKLINELSRQSIATDPLFVPFNSAYDFNDEDGYVLFVEFYDAILSGMSQFRVHDFLVSKSANGSVILDLKIVAGPITLLSDYDLSMVVVDFFYPMDSAGIFTFKADSVIRDLRLEFRLEENGKYKLITSMWEQTDLEDTQFVFRNLFSLVKVVFDYYAEFYTLMFIENVIYEYQKAELLYLDDLINEIQRN